MPRVRPRPVGMLLSISYLRVVGSILVNEGYEVPLNIHKPAAVDALVLLYLSVDFTGLTVRTSEHSHTPLLID